MKKTKPNKDIKIRRANLDDLEAIHEIFSRPKAYSGTLQLPYPSLEFWRKQLAEPASGTYNFVAVVDGKAVGQLTLQTFPDKPRRKHAGTFGIVVHDNWQGQGIGKALLSACVDLADKWLNLTRLELEVYVDNESAIQLYKRFGFGIEGTLRQYAFREGEYVDSYFMGRIRPDREIS